MIDDKDLKAADVAKYHVVLFGDPGSKFLDREVEWQAAT